MFNFCDFDYTFYKAYDETATNYIFIYPGIIICVQTILDCTAYKDIFMMQSLIWIKCENTAFTAYKRLQSIKKEFWRY